MREQGIQFKTAMPGQPIQVDLKNATQIGCECGGKYFVPAAAIYRVSALMSPTGQELTAQRPVMVCMSCGKALEDGASEKLV